MTSFPISLTVMVFTPASGKAGIRVVHLSPDAPAVDITTTGTSSTSLAINLNLKGYNCTLILQLVIKTYR